MTRTIGRSGGRAVAGRRSRLARLLSATAVVAVSVSACTSGSTGPEPTGTESTGTESTGTESTGTESTDSTAAPDTGAAISATAPATTEPTSVDAADDTFAALHPAVGYGLLRVMTLEERPDPLDVVVYQALPNEMPRVAGVITTVAQTPLSHVNLRAVQDDVPNAMVSDILDDPALAALVGRHVRYEVTDSGYTIEATTQAEVEAHHAATRPTEEQVPERDLQTRAIASLDDIGFDDWDAYGVKAANLATLRSFELPDADIPAGFAIPFFYYVEFMTTNGFFTRVEDLLADPAFRDDPDAQEAELAELRQAIEDAPMPDWMMSDLEKLQASFPADTSLRCRSSTNNEDLADFSGAGLYDSKTQRPDEGHLSKCVKQVYASVWSLRAFLERDFYRIDHLATAMGVLVHPNFDDETANGVAVSVDPVYGTEDAFYVNTQLGEDLVTNPDAQSFPEELLIYADGTSYVVAYSNLVEPGDTLLGDEQVAALQSSLRVIHDRFAELYQVEPGERFAMEVEFKITAADELSIKQARTWIFR